MLLCFRPLASVTLEDDEIFASNMKYVGLQFHEPKATPKPVKSLLVMLQKYATI